MIRNGRSASRPVLRGTGRCAGRAQTRHRGRDPQRGVRLPRRREDRHRPRRWSLGRSGVHADHRRRAHTGRPDGRRAVAVTGTIEPDGSVGPIGGVAEKAVTAESAGAELFLVPEQEAAKSGHAGGAEVVGIASLNDACSRHRAQRRRRRGSLRHTDAAAVPTTLVRASSGIRASAIQPPRLAPLGGDDPGLSVDADPSAADPGGDRAPTLPAGARGRTRRGLRPVVPAGRRAVPQQRMAHWTP